MKISVANTKTQLISTLQLIINDWLKDGVIQPLIYYCNNSTEFPYSQLRKMEKMGLIRSISSSKRNKTYEWLGPAHPNLEQIAMSIINYTGKENKDFVHLSTMGFNDDQKRSEIIRFFKPGTEETKRKETEQKSDKDLTKLTVKIALILQKNGVPEESIEPITASILSLLE